MAEQPKDKDRVRSLFDGVADHYDLMNRFMTFGRDRTWRRFLVKKMELSEGMTLLDVATGTGDLIAEAARHEPTISGHGLDFSENMLVHARARLLGHGATLVQGDANNLPFEDEKFNRVVSGFLIRNVESVERAFAEQYRVLRPGGMIGCIDTTPPTYPLIAPLVRLYFRTIIPLLARAFTGDVQSYRYLTQTTERFKTAEQVARIMESVGFRDVAYRRFMFGSIAVHWARRPERPQ